MENALSIIAESEELLELVISHLDSFELNGIEEKEKELLVYGMCDKDMESAISNLKKKYPDQLTFRYFSVNTENWNNSWESNFEPISIRDFCHIRAGFHEKPINTYEQEIIITPKMSFGTGHHETTQLMIEAMSQLDLQNKRITDFGSGTGVLAILANKMGARVVIAIENDKMAVDNAHENIRINDATTISLLHESDLKKIPLKQDLILANITRNVILDFKYEFLRLLNPRGLLVTSGYLISDQDLISIEMQEIGFANVSSNSQEKWGSNIFQKSSN